MNSRWNSTEAYDLSLYEVPAEPAKRPQPVPAAKNKAQSRKAAQRGAMRRLTACAVLVVVFLAMVLYQNVSTIELGNEIQTQNDLYAALQDEYSYLSGKLTAKTAQEVDSYAAAQGLCKMQDYQVSYIRLNDTDVAVRTEAAPSGSVLESLMDSMDTALEYLRIK